MFNIKHVVIIHEVYPDGAAAKDGRLKPGDQLVEVNGEDFRNISHVKALGVLRQTPAKVCNNTIIANLVIIVHHAKQLYRMK